MHIAIVGTGIAGLAAAHRLHRHAKLTLFEAGSHVGGHTRTIEVVQEDRTLSVDTGFMVYNESTYPEFTQLLDDLGVQSYPTTMSFSVHQEGSGIEYSGTSINTVFAQRRNLLRPSFLRMTSEIVRFNRVAKRRLERPEGLTTLQAFFLEEGLSTSVQTHYILPMGAAIWSTSPEGMKHFPAYFFLRFLDNHGLLSVDREHLPWRTLVGGAKSYVARLIHPFRERIRLREPVSEVVPRKGSVDVVTAAGTQRFDRAVLALHADQALKLLRTPTQLEQEILGAFPYQRNHAVVHSDVRLMPKKKRAWASWNYRFPKNPVEAATLTYDMNSLQGLGARPPVFVTLNLSQKIDPARILDEVTFEHPAFSLASLAAQQRFDEIDGVRGVHFAGAYWRNGFHEDGFFSGRRAAERVLRFAASPPQMKRALA